MYGWMAAAAAACQAFSSVSKHNHKFLLRKLFPQFCLHYHRRLHRFSIDFMSTKTNAQYFVGISAIYSMNYRYFHFVKLAQAR